MDALILLAALLSMVINCIVFFMILGLDKRAEHTYMLILQVSRYLQHGGPGQQMVGQQARVQVIRERKDG